MKGEQPQAFIRIRPEPLVLEEPEYPNTLTLTLTLTSYTLMLGGTPFLFLYFVPLGLFRWSHNTTSLNQVSSQGWIVLKKNIIIVST